MTLFLPSFWWKNLLSAGEIAQETFKRVRSGENLFLAFNNIRNAEGGESDEFTTIRNVQSVLKRMGVPQGSTVIGIGARTGHPEDPYGAPGEMGYLWKVGEPWNAKVTSIKDASPVALHLDDPIPVTQVGVLNEKTAHHFEINDPRLEGSVLWTLYNDETGSQALNIGMHNLFSDVDGGMLELIFKTSQSALKNPESWATNKVRKDLLKFIPNLSKERVWENFSETLSLPFIHSRWLPYVREQGWQGAAIVLKGSLENVAEFHLTEWSRTSPAEPAFQIGAGTHTSLKIKAGREARPFIKNSDGTWTMVGFIWDLENDTSTPSMPEYRDFADIFGQDFHIHGFRDDQSIGGHALFAMLGAGKLSVSLYPLSFDRNETAFLFNNDLMVVRESIAQSGSFLSVKVRNSGENFVRNVGLQLSRRNLVGSHVDIENLKIPVMRPHEEIQVFFRGQTALNSSAKRTLWLDREGRFIEGGDGVENNKVNF